jgi:hypothetical protein
LIRSCSPNISRRKFEDNFSRSQRPHEDLGRRVFRKARYNKDKAEFTVSLSKLSPPRYREFMALSRLCCRKSFYKAEELHTNCEPEFRHSSPKGAECRHVHSTRLPGAFSLVKHVGVQPHQSFGSYSRMIKLLLPQSPK